MELPYYDTCDYLANPSENEIKSVNVHIDNNNFQKEIAHLFEDFNYQTHC
jgi:hypothetical protein